MKNRPILFSAPMVRAILEGRKTMTRRVMRIQPSEQWSPAEYGDIHKMRAGDFVLRHGEPLVVGWGPCSADGEEGYSCPYGQPGDRLWLRETWCHAWDGERDCWTDPERYYYRADGVEVVDEDGDDRSPWKPSIHMPRRASRITLEVTGVRVERLQEISYEDSIAEGIGNMASLCDEMDPSWRNIAGETTEVVARRLRWPQREFKNLWTSINGAGSWEANPWVWVVEFQRMRT